MKKLFVLGLILVNTVCIFAQQKEKLTNETILEMVSLGFADEVIIQKIQASECSFQTGLSDLKVLKEKNISGPVMAAMIAAHDKTIEAQQSVLDSRTGIFYKDASGDDVKLMPTVFSKTKTRTLAAGLTYGIASGKIKSLLDAPSSATKIARDSVKFIFYFKPFNDTQHQATDWWFRAATSPKEFVLVRLKAKRSERELETGKANVWVGSEAGVNDKSVVDFDILTNGEGCFTVIPKTLMEPGEYCFYYKGTIPQGGFTNQSVFDFSVIR